ncbi:MAG: hypothetical protein QM804_11565 [Propionicimonas sp.]
MRPSHFAPSLIGSLVSIVFLILLVTATVALIWWLIRRRKAAAAGFPAQPHWQPGPGHPGQPPTPQPPANAVQILDERLARGDLEVDDYLARRAALLGDRPPNGAEFQHPTERPDQPT